MTSRTWRYAGMALLAGLAALAPLAGHAAPAADAADPPPSDRQVAEGLFLSSAPTARKRQPACGEASDKAGDKTDIVVCGADRGERWRVPSTTDSDPTAREAQRTGIARAPNVSALPDCSRGCIGFGKAPPRVYSIDLSKMPKAPAESDADRVARGEMAER